MNVQVSFMVRVEFAENCAFGPHDIQEAVAEAVKNAMMVAENDGYGHDRSDLISISLNSNVVAKVID